MCFCWRYVTLVTFTVTIPNPSTFTEKPFPDRAALDSGKARSMRSASTAALTLPNRASLSVTWAVVVVPAVSCRRNTNSSESSARFNCVTMTLDSAQDTPSSSTEGSLPA